ncbi:hypothetical protein CUR178_07532 [Leishmania enriettii]|uniref:protein-serine/threonine phosphatase n=1 Tax=Leishmania enriettii TaxID=5663 RepID=A0A836I0Q6_LEIEN|nr:hypothetical protein CUR178_07532 [Leishmania enriettii]
MGAMELPLISSIGPLVAAPAAHSAAGREEAVAAPAASAVSAPAATRVAHRLLSRCLRSAARGSSAAPPTPWKAPSAVIVEDASSLTASFTVTATRCASRDTTHGGSTHRRSCSRSRSPPLVQTTSASAATFSAPSFLVTPRLQAACISSEVAASTPYTGENCSDVACLCQDEEASRDRRASYRCIDLFSSLSFSDSTLGTTEAHVRESERHSLPVMEAELVSVDGAGVACAISPENAAAVQLSVLGSLSSYAKPSTGFAGAPLSDRPAAVAVMAREGRDARVALPTGVRVDIITATDACRSIVSSSILSHSGGFQLLDEGARDAPCRRTNLGEVCGCPDTADGISLLEHLNGASPARDSLDAVSNGDVAPPMPDTVTFAHVEESTPFSPAPDAPLVVALSVIESPKGEDFSRDVEGLDAGEDTRMPTLCALTLPSELVGGAAAPRTRRSGLWRPEVVTSRSRSTTETAPASSRRKVQDIDSDDGGAPSLVLHDFVALRLSPRSMGLEGRSKANNGPPDASACSTPLLPLTGSRSSGSGVLFSMQLPAEPPGMGLTTPTEVAAAALPAAALEPATARSRSATSGTPLLDSFRVVLSPCPSNIAPCFTLVPCPATSRVSSPVPTSEKTVQQRWRYQVRARTGAGVGGGSGTSPYTAAAHSLDPAGARASSSQSPPHCPYAVGSSRNGNAICVAPLQDWEPPLLPRSGGEDDAHLPVAPLSLSASSLRTAVSLPELMPGVVRGHVSSPQHDVPEDGRCVLDVASERVDTLLAGTGGEDLVSTCSTPPPPTRSRPRPSPLLISQRAPACASFCRRENPCMWNAVPASVQSMVQTSPRLLHGSPLSGTSKTSVPPSWAPSLCTSPLTAVTVGGPRSKGEAGPTCRWGMRLHDSAAYDAAPADGDSLVHFGVEPELCGLQRAPTAFSPPSSLSSALPASTEATVRAHQQPAPSTPHVDSESGGPGSNGAGSSCVYACSARLLVPPPPLVALSADRFSLSLISPLADITSPLTAATGTAAPTATASVHYSSPSRCHSPVPCVREPDASLPATLPASVEEGDAQAGISAALDPANGISTAAAESASSRLPVSLLAASPATQFQCSFSSLRGRRSRQEDSVMIVAELPVRMCSVPTAVPTAAEAYAARDLSGQPSSASARHGADAAGEDGGPAETAAAMPHIIDEQGEVVFSCFGVFDGHCGDTVASLASQFFPEHFEHALQAHQSQWARDRRESLGAPCDTDGSVEGSVAEQQHRHREIAPAGAAEFQRVVSAAVVQALVHLDLTLYDVLHGATQGHSAQCRDAGSTATVAALFRTRSAGASDDTGVGTVVGSCVNGTLRSRTGDGRVPCSSGDSAATRTSAPSDKSWEPEERAKAVAPPTRPVRTEGTYRLCIANLGDSRAIIGNLHTGELLLSTTDHRVSADPSEAARILAAGGVVEFGRVDGTLDVTRGLGDYRYKVAPAQWWTSAPAALVTGASTSVSPASLAASSGAATAATAMWSSQVTGVAGRVPPASIPRIGSASEVNSAARALRWPSLSSTRPPSPMRDSAGGGGAAMDDCFSFIHSQYAGSEAQPTFAPHSPEPPPSGTAERRVDADTAPAQHPQPTLPFNPPSPISSPSPLSPWCPLASASTVTLVGNAVSNIADVYEWEVGRGEVLIMASDGVWDRMASEEVLDFVRHELTTARWQSKAAAAEMAFCGGTQSNAVSGAAMETRKSLSVNSAHAEASSATKEPWLSLGEALECDPLRHPSPCQAPKSTSARRYSAALLCTPSGSGVVARGQDEGAECSLADTTGDSPRFFAVQAAARRLAEHVVDSLSSSDNATVVIVVFD